MIGIVLVWFISFFNLTVSNGMINGTIFYANIVKVNRDILYPSLSEGNVFSLIIAWINLNYGFETCLFNGMTEFHKALLQLTFPVYTYGYCPWWLYTSHDTIGSWEGYSESTVHQLWPQ